MNEGAGDWICSDPSCGNINFARRISCYRCNKDRPDGGKMFKKKLGTEIGKSAAEKSRGLFNADDWQCNKCANVNWARRTTCNVCNAPKFGEVEARTGYGGGYNERGVVEYRRREPSSDDEYDEFGRKKRKRKLDPQNTVGITEGPLAKKLSPALLQMELNMDAKEDPAPNVSMQTKKDTEKARRSLSDSSMCELPPLSKMAFRRHQLENQTNYNRQEHMLPSFKTNGNNLRKRFPTDQDSINNKIASKILKHEINNSPSTKNFAQNKIVKVQTLKLQSPKNNVQPLKNNVIYKFTGPNPTEDFEVSYSIEERVKVAAYAIVHNNCKISTEKFEAIYDKPAPDFKTIFAWRQRLLRTGCLDDSHIHTDNQLSKKNESESTNSNNNVNHTSKPQLNPEEIHISSDSDTDYTINDQVHNKIQAQDIVCSPSVETLVIGNTQKPPGSSDSPAVEPAPQVRNHSSPHQRGHSSSHDTQDSSYSDSELDKVDDSSKSKNISVNSNGHQNKQSIVLSDSDSVSYDSDYVDFLSRVYGEGTKPRSHLKKRQTPMTNKANSESSPKGTSQVFQGYCTVKKSEQSPLATGNIYTSNTQHMQVRSNANLADADSAATEYIPTKLGSSTQKNYQDFKNNVKKKGYWAKGNQTTVQKNKILPNEKCINNHSESKFEKIMSVLQSSVAIPLLNSKEDSIKTAFTNDIFDCGPEQSQVAGLHGDDFTNDDFEQIVTAENYTPFDKPMQTNEPAAMLDDSSRIFDVVQSNSVQKNKSIMEIFDVFDDQNQETNCLENGITARPYTMVWDEDDDALYKDDDTSVLHNNTENSYPNKFEADPQNLRDIESKILNHLAPEGPHISSKTNAKELNGEGELFTNNPEALKTPYQRDDTRKVLCQVIQPHINKDENKNISTNNQTLEKAVSENRVPKKINIIESITIMPKTNNPVQPYVMENQHQTANSTLAHDNKSPLKFAPIESTSGSSTQPNVNLSNLLAGINTDTLLLALQNLQQLAQKPPDGLNQPDEQAGQSSGQDAQSEPVETINLTNDEDWEKESDREGSIERQLKKLHGNTCETPFLSDIFDPGPVVIPPNIAINLNINNQQNGDNSLPEVQENTSVIGNFKSFALPKPIMLNRLKLTIKQPDKTPKQIEGRKRRRKKKSKASASTGEGKGEDAAEKEGAVAGEEGDEEESGDDADLSKYDLWGSDDEKAHSSKTETTEKAKEGEGTEVGSVAAEKNGKTDTPENKTAKRRSRSSSTSSSSSSSSSSSRSSADAPKNKFDDFNLNSERESSPGHRAHSPHSRGAGAGTGAGSGTRRKPPARARAAGDHRSHETGRDKQKSRERRERRGSRSRSRSRPARKERRYSRDGAANHYAARGRHR